MQNTETLKLTAQGDREIVMTRMFDAPRKLVFQTFTKPDWLSAGCSDRTAGPCRSARSI